jgi:FtsP/CotA-like multicopper oxidase with cupredoxin domain
MLTRRTFLATSAALTLPRPAWAATPTLTVASRQLEVLGRAATVYGITNASGGNGLTAREGDRFTGTVLNDTSDDLILHWHGQTRAAADQDRTRPGGGVQASGTTDAYDFELTPGTHWMHSHTLTEQLLLAAPMVTVEADATTPEATVMLHDFAFRSPAEILAELGASGMHDMATMGSGDHAGHDMAAMAPGMVHANDVAYDAFLANDRTLADPQVIAVDPGPFRLRIINGATATAFWLDTGLPTQVIATDGVPCKPMPGQHFPIAQGQRLDLLVMIPPEGGAFPILAQVESARMRTGVILATAGAQVNRVSDMADADSEPLDLRLDAALSAATTPPDRAAQMLHITLGMQPGYVWTLNDGAPLQAALGARVELMVMNPTPMMHPMHLHGHHFQVVDVGMGRFAGPMRDTVIVPPMGMVTVAVDLDKAGGWYLHCHHLYHMAGGMMTTLDVA